MRKVLVLFLLAIAISLSAKAENTKKNIKYDPTECGCSSVKVLENYSKYKNHVTFRLKNYNPFKVKVIVSVYYAVGNEPNGNPIYEKVSYDYSYIIPAKSTTEAEYRIDHWAGKYTNDVREYNLIISLEHCYEIR